MIKPKKSNHIDYSGADELLYNAPIEGTEAPKGDPFHYGKKKKWNGTTEGAYYATNVPRGQRPRDPNELPISSSLKSTQKSKTKKRATHIKNRRKITTSTKRDTSYTGSFSNLIGRKFGV